jgi:uncharacterized protein YkwD
MKKLSFTLLLTALLLAAHSWKESSLATQLAPTPQPGRISSLIRPDDQVQPAFSGCGGENASQVNADFEQQVVELVNDARADQGLAPLKRSEPLDQAARYHATDLGQDDYFDHDTYDRQGSEVVFVCNTWQRIEAYTSGANAENIAAGYSDPPEVMEAWMSSTGHRDNILTTYSWELGIGYYEGSGRFPNYWVQDFGRRDDVYPLIINGEDSSTDSPSVSLYIYGDWQEMRLRNDNGVWTDWQPFQTVIGWTLHDGAGDHTVTAELRAGSQTATSSDTIYLNADSSQPALGNLPDSLSFFFSIPDQRLIPQVHSVTPLNQGNGAALEWQVTVDGPQFNNTPSNGSTPDSITIGAENFDQQSPGTYSGTLTVTVTDPQDVNGSPHAIELTLHVVETSFQPLYLPMLNK